MDGFRQLLKPVAEFQLYVDQMVGIPSGVQNRILISIGIFVAARILAGISAALLHRQVKDQLQYHRYKQIVNRLFTVLSILIVVRIWFGGLSGLSTYFGLLSAGLAIALSDLISSLAGWAFITLRKPFSAGDRIQVGEFSGDVIDVRPFQFSLLEIGNWVQADQSTGRVLHLPNSWAFTHPVANYTSGFKFIWHEVSVVVTFESDWEKAKRILTEIVEKHGSALTESAEQQVRRTARRYMIYYSKLTPIVWTSVLDIGVNLTMRLIVDPRTRRSIEEKVWEDVLRAFAKESDIDFAYPTQRFYDNRREGKPGAGGLPGTAGPG